MCLDVNNSFFAIIQQSFARFIDPVPRQGFVVSPPLTNLTSRQAGSEATNALRPGAKPADHGVQRQGGHRQSQRHTTPDQTLDGEVSDHEQRVQV